MVPVQDLREKTFEKAVKGSNMAQVDEFLDELAADFSTLNKENASLKAKLRVLAQKVDEYRQTEDSMRLALRSAQKLSTQIETEARERADNAVAEAQDYAERITKQAADAIANEQAKLEEAKKATNKFFEHMKTVCQKQMDFYDKLNQMQLVGGDAEPAKPAPVRVEKPAKPSREEEVDEVVRSIESSAKVAALAEVEDIEDVEDDPDLEVDTDLPEEEEEPTRPYLAGGQGQKKKRSFDDFRFDDDI